MRKIILTAVVAMMSIITMQAEGYDYPFLTFQTTTGELTSVAVDGLTLTVDDGNIVTSAGATFALSSLAKMYFTSADVTAIENVNANDNGNLDGSITVYTHDGAMVGTFGSIKSALPQLRKGAYIVKGISGTIKVMKQ
ncbi:MAG: hypothetical protein IKQ32_06550 [Prevotella sp.]|nr:hypothetical protein [Prevotella sp.]